MNKEEITISELIKLIESGEGKSIRLRNWQLAQLFGVYESTVRANIKSIIKSNIVKPEYDSTLVQTGRILLPEAFGLDMIIALAFRLDSANANILRKWILRETAKPVDILDNRIFLIPLNNMILN
jgi:hypothetical protein